MNFCLIGHPVAHSLSPLIHQRLFKLSGVDAKYSLFDINPDELEKTREKLKSFDGFNCTIPFKERIIALLDDVRQSALKYGAVNTVKNESGRLAGYNTDGEGFLLAAKLAGIPLNRRVVITGAGGVARVLAFEAARLAESLTIAARRLEQAAALAQAVKSGTGLDIKAVTLSELDDMCGRFDVLLQATPAGMHPNADGSAVSYKFAQNIQFVFDTIYNPLETKLLKIAKAAGAVTSNGLGMLIFQAAAAQRIWTGAEFEQSSLIEIIGEAARVLAQN